jgi:hypothetical protein
LLLRASKRKADDSEREKKRKKQKNAESVQGALAADHPT